MQIPYNTPFQYISTNNELKKTQTGSVSNANSALENQAASSDISFKGLGLSARAGVFLNKIFNNGDCISSEERKLLNKINSLEAEYENLTDEQLQNKTNEFKEILSKRKTSTDKMEDKRLEQQALDEILPEAYATVREASKRVLGMRHFDVQILGGIALHNHEIAEMNTGEGKTLTATLPAYLNALTGKGVHIITVNDYLAKRDCEKMGKLYNFLGLTAGVVPSDKSDPNVFKRKKEAYDCDITYATNKELGFDYLRDNMVLTADKQVQRPYNFAIVDEVDSILIDEARSSLIMNGGAACNYTQACKKMKEVADKLERDVHYEVDEKKKSVFLTEEGMDKAQEILGISDLFTDPDPYSDNNRYTNQLIQSLRAKELYKENTDYIVKDGEIVVVDEFTGRSMKGRQWGGGLHRALEAKHGLQIKNETNIIASVTYQNLFRLYSKLAGMTGTAGTEKEEFLKIYHLYVNKIPTNSEFDSKNGKKTGRQDFPDEIYKTQKAKLNAIVREIKEMNDKGRPVLVGTTSVEKSEQLSKILKEHNIKHNVLNAKNAEKEAYIIAQAGRLGAVTIATNMAGRGTDILLGGNPEYLAEEELKKKNITPENTPEYEKIKAKIIKEKKQITQPEAEKVRNLGGLHVIGTEKHEARRIDNQLRGRAARQGDPGSTKFYSSFEDDLMRLFADEETLNKVAKLAGIDDDTPIVDEHLSSQVEKVQKRIEGQHYAMRKSVIEYDEVLNMQRSIFNEQRNEILHKDDLRDNIINMVGKEAERLVKSHISSDMNPKEYDYENLSELIKDIQDEIPQLSDLKVEDIQNLKFDEMTAKIKELAVEAYNAHEKAIIDSCNAFSKAQYPNNPKHEKSFDAENTMRKLEKAILLKIADYNWINHLYAMDDLRSGIGLVTYAKKNPLIEYKLSAFDMFNSTVTNIQTETVKRLFQTPTLDEMFSRYQK